MQQYQHFINSALTNHSIDLEVKQKLHKGVYNTRR
jgi:hypothetical protein